MDLASITLDSALQMYCRAFLRLVLGQISFCSVNFTASTPKRHFVFHFPRRTTRTRPAWTEPRLRTRFWIMRLPAKLYFLRPTYYEPHNDVFFIWYSMMELAFYWSFRAAAPDFRTPWDVRLKDMEHGGKKSESIWVDAERWLREFSCDGEPLPRPQWQRED